MKILYHHRTQLEDAQGVHVTQMIQAFCDLGHEVQMVALVELNRTSQREVRGKKWSWVTNWIPGWCYELMSIVYNLYGYYRFWRAIRARRPDLLYERYSLNTFCGILASQHFGIPLVLEVNAPLCYEQSQLGKLTFKNLARFSERWICSHSTWTIVVSKVMKDILLQEGVSDEKIVVMPNGINPEMFHPHISGEAVRRRYDLQEKIVIGFVGWFRKWHGLEMLLEIIYEARLGDRGVRLLLVGDGPAYQDLSRYTDEHDLRTSVIFTGPIEQRDVPAHIAAMDIAVQPSATEYACPMKIFEYMAMGKCIVAPKQPNICEILEDGVTGFLFQPMVKDDLRSVLMELMSDPEGRKLVSKKAHESVFRHEFLWRANAQKVLDLIFRDDTNIVCSKEAVASIRINGTILM